MPRIARGQSGGLYTHVINRGNGRQRVFCDDEDYAAFVDLLGQACERIAMRVVACCLMPNHFHLVVWPREDTDLSRWMQWLMTSHVRRHHARHGGSGHVWGGRFKSFVIQHRRISAAQRQRGVMNSGDPVLDVMRYVERNPVRAGLATEAAAWVWSSMHWWHKPNAAPPFWREVGIHRPSDWRALVNRPQTDAELDALRQCIGRGRPFGSQPWVKHIAAALGLESSLRPRGRPRKRPKSSLSP